MDLSQLTQHPDFDEILQKLTTGKSPKGIADWLKIKYSGAGNAHLRLPVKLLKSFLDGHYQDFLSDVRKDLDLIKAGEKVDPKLAKSLKENKTYQELINARLEKENKELDYKEIMANAITGIEKRIHQVFDKIQQDPEYIGNNTEYAMIKWFDALINSIKKYDEVFNKKPDTVINNNTFNTQIIHQHLSVLQDAVREVINEFEPEIALKFTEKLEQKLQILNPAKIEILTLESKAKQVHALESSIKSQLNNLQLEA